MKLIAWPVLFTLLLSGCVIVPVPHMRLQEPGVKGRLLDARSFSPLKNARIEDSAHDVRATCSGADGEFILEPVYGWHGAYLVSPVSLSLFPALDMPSPERTIVVTAQGYHRTSIPLKAEFGAAPYIQAGNLYMRR